MASFYLHDAIGLVGHGCLLRVVVMLDAAVAEHPRSRKADRRHAVGYGRPSASLGAFR